jgi:hypothetical protein
VQDDCWCRGRSRKNESHGPEGNIPFPVIFILFDPLPTNGVDIFWISLIVGAWLITVAVEPSGFAISNELTLVPVDSRRREATAQTASSGIGLLTPRAGDKINAEIREVEEPCLEQLVAIERLAGQFVPVKDKRRLQPAKSPSVASDIMVLPLSSRLNVWYVKAEVVVFHDRWSGCLKKEKCH